MTPVQIQKSLQERGKFAQRVIDPWACLHGGHFGNGHPSRCPQNIVPGKAVELGDEAVLTSLKHTYLTDSGLHPRQLAGPVPPKEGGGVLHLAISDCSSHWLNRIMAVLLTISRCASPSGLLEQNTRHWVACRRQEFTSHGSGGCKSKMKALAGLLSAELQLPGSHTAMFSLCLHKAEG